MSVKAISWAWETHPPTPTQKLILVALADHSDHEGICWPGEKGIAAKCGLARETVSRNVQLLQDQGYLSIEHRSSDNGARITNIYRLHIENAKPCDAQSHTPCDRESDPPVTRSHNPSDAESHPPVTRSHNPSDAESHPPVTRSHNPCDPGSIPPVIQDHIPSDPASHSTNEPSIRTVNLEPSINNKDSCAPQNGAAPAPKNDITIFEIPLKKNQGSFAVTDAVIEEYERAYPSLDVVGLLVQIRQWNIDNPAKRKTRSGIRKHINGWLSVEKDKAGRRKPKNCSTLSDLLGKTNEDFEKTDWARFDTPDERIPDWLRPAAS